MSRVAGLRLQLGRSDALLAGSTFGRPMHRHWARASSPTGWASCAGSFASRADDPELVPKAHAVGVVDTHIYAQHACVDPRADRCEGEALLESLGHARTPDQE